MLVIALGAVAIDYAFRSLLLDQSRGQIAATADDLQRNVTSASAAQLYGGPPLALVLANRAQLDHFASAQEYVQVDTLSGQVLGKSSNLGGATLPRLGAGANNRVSRLDVPGLGNVLVLDRVLADADGVPVAVGHVAGSLALAEALAERAREILLAVAIAAMFAIAGASYVIAATAIDPIDRLTGAIEEIGSERLDRRLRWRREDELGRLAAAFDAMLDRLQSAFARERQFISDASHELRTPLTVINANAQMLRRWGDRDASIRAESLAAIASESERLAAMVSGMLTLSKAESGDDIPKEPLVLERIAADVVAHAHERAAAKGLTLAADLPPAQTSIVVGDAGLLRQMVGNLVDNAIKFTPSGSIDVAIEPLGREVALHVSDTGVGIDDDGAETLFDRFSRGDPSHARTIEGTGLGLAIVRSIARVHGGAVHAAPRPGGGSVFTVTLPCEPESFSERS